MRKKITDRKGVDAFKNHFTKFQIADKDGDLDMDPYTSTSWDGDSFSTGTGTINWQTAFSVPERPKMVFIRVSLRDSSATPAAGVLQLKAKNTTTNDDFVIRSLANNVINDGHGLVSVAADGTSYYQITASGAGTCDIWIYVLGWVK